MAILCSRIQPTTDHIVLSSVYCWKNSREYTSAVQMYVCSLVNCNFVLDWNRLLTFCVWVILVVQLPFVLFFFIIYKNFGQNIILNFGLQKSHFLLSKLTNSWFEKEMPHFYWLQILKFHFFYSQNSN